MEGFHCYLQNCKQAGMTLPVAEYTHVGGNCSIIGGFVYRGRGSPGMRGEYFYADLCSGRVWVAEHQGSAWVSRQLLATGFSLTTFGEDEAGEIYLANAGNGTIVRIDGSVAPRLVAAGVVNAASFAGGMVPGSLTTIFAGGLRDTEGSTVASQVPLPPSLDSVSVTVAGITAPVYSVSNVNGQEQVSFQAPFEIAGRNTASVVVTRGGQASASVDVPVLAVQAGVYPVVIHAADFSLVTAARPLVAGEFATIYVSGLGAVTNAPATGAAAPAGPLARTVANVRVTLGGVDCEVQFAGLAPGLVGVYQVNFRVPAGASGDIVVSAGQ
jgi:uncharacterized protein (TIGR03437 family)